VVSGFYYLKLSVFQYHHKKGEKAKKSPSPLDKKFLVAEVPNNLNTKLPDLELSRINKKSTKLNSMWRRFQR
jgi:hypothetical protein